MVIISPGSAAPVTRLPARTGIGTVVACPETLATFGVGLLDAHGLVAKVHLDHVALGSFHVDLALFHITLHGLAQGHFATLIFCFIEFVIDVLLQEVTVAGEFV